MLLLIALENKQHITRRGRSLISVMYCEQIIWSIKSKLNYYLPKSNETPDDSQSRAHTIKTKPLLIDVEEKRLSEREDCLSNR